MEGEEGMLPLSRTSNIADVLRDSILSESKEGHHAARSVRTEQGQSAMALGTLGGSDLWVVSETVIHSEAGPWLLSADSISIRNAMADQERVRVSGWMDIGGPRCSQMRPGWYENGGGHEHQSNVPSRR